MLKGILTVERKKKYAGWSWLVWNIHWRTASSKWINKPSQKRIKKKKIVLFLDSFQEIKREKFSKANRLSQALQPNRGGPVVMFLYSFSRNFVLLLLQLIPATPYEQRVRSSHCYWAMIPHSWWKTAPDCVWCNLGPPAFEIYLVQ